MTEYYVLRDMDNRGDEQQIMEQAVADIWGYWPFRRTAR